MINLRRRKTIGMLGITGAGMKALAQVLADWGKQIIGFEDFQGSLKLTDSVTAPIRLSPELDQAQLDAVIFSTAHINNLHLRRWRNRGLAISYPYAVSWMFEENFGLAVAGSHGKTTSAAMAAVILKNLGLDLTALVGGEIISLGRNGWGGKEWLLIAEVDEYQDKFNFYLPDVSLITNIEFDHPDFFTSPGHYLDAFSRFIDRTMDDGQVVINLDDPTLAQMSQDYSDLVTFGRSPKARFRIMSSGFNGQATEFEIGHQGKLYRFSLPLAGRHNVDNAVGALVAAGLTWCKYTANNWLDFWSMAVQKQVLKDFRGVGRRFQYRGQWQHYQVYDDYAHHPTQVKQVLETLRQLHPAKPITIVYEPHTVSRAKYFANDFYREISLADRAVILPVYQAWRDLGERFESHLWLTQFAKNKTFYAENFEQVKDCLELKPLAKSEILVLMGAGRIDQLWPYLQSQVAHVSS